MTLGHAAIVALALSAGRAAPAERDWPDEQKGEATVMRENTVADRPERRRGGSPSFDADERAAQFVTDVPGLDPRAR